MAPSSRDDAGRIPPELGVSREFDMSTTTRGGSDVDATQFHPGMGLLIAGMCGQSDHQFRPFSLPNQESEEDEGSMKASGAPSAEPQQSVNDETKAYRIQPLTSEPLRRLRNPLGHLAYRESARVEHCLQEVGPHPDGERGFRHPGEPLGCLRNWSEIVAVLALHSGHSCGSAAQPSEAIT